MVNVGIIGATGYAGEELIGILLKHPGARLADISAKIDQPRPIGKFFPKFAGRIDLVCAEPDIKKINNTCDLVFLALPHTVSLRIAPKLLSAGKRVIDLSADYRLKDAKVYEKFYQLKHTDSGRLSEAVYGLPEIYRAKIKSARLVANPGCYPTAGILALSPLLALGLAETGAVIIDAKSGVTGAGRKLAEGFLFSEINEDFRAYKVNFHQHAPEIDQELSKLAGKKIKVTFVPHLLPLSRGILETIYVKRAQSAPFGGVPRQARGSARGKQRKAQNLIKLYKRFYQKEPFVRIREEGDFPRIKDVAGTNFCDIGIKDCGDSVIIIAAIDNLLKGAAGQAVQNMNIMCGFPEETALL
ncbi:MAG: N-acetyl-gamma-glutamyl-phosphate reductase [Omnitrophica WOR_2 bacterium RIFCSPLOWO2_12_FULL_51_8]|nr:MAG: N-acetyl-gamma-glutamyl-phosphate reductase [Omnitrophica WOR_2 bacterium RIFCSPLOWO2_12_FULL_51_8]